MANLLSAGSSAVSSSARLDSGDLKSKILKYPENLEPFHFYWLF